MFVMLFALLLFASLLLLADISNGFHYNSMIHKQQHPLVDSTFRIFKKRLTKPTTTSTNAVTCFLRNRGDTGTIHHDDKKKKKKKEVTRTSLWGSKNYETDDTSTHVSTDEDVVDDILVSSTNSHEEEDVVTDDEVVMEVDDIHPKTIDAIANGLLTREQENPNMPLRFIDDGSMEPWQITMTVGKIAEHAIGQFQKEQQTKKKNHQRTTNDSQHQQLLEQTMGGRIVAVLFRLDELEQLLDEQLSTSSKLRTDDEYQAFGGIRSANSMDSNTNKQQQQQNRNNDDSNMLLKQLILDNEEFRRARASSLLALFLHTIEGPGMKHNNITVPCMDINFLTATQKEQLLHNNKNNNNNSNKNGNNTHKINNDQSINDTSIEELKDDAITASTDSTTTTTITNNSNAMETFQLEEDRPSLHPITIQAIAEALQLRAQNKTTSPLRLITNATEWYEVQYTAVSFAQRFMEKQANQEFLSTLTEDERKTIAGRIVAVLMRLDDLEWEWNHRIIASFQDDKKEEDGNGISGKSSDMTVGQYNNNDEDHWKYSFGLLPTTMDHQYACISTLDTTLLFDDLFAKIRAERLLAVFLLNIEGPSLEKANTSMPGGSQVDFITNPTLIELMMPNQSKKNGIE